MPQNPLPNVSSLSKKLAEANLRIDRVIESLPGVVDHLIQAADRKEWREVSRLSQLLSRSCQEQGVPLDAPAEELSTTAQNQGEPQIKRSLLRLIGASGRLRRQGNIAPENGPGQNVVQPE